MTKAHVNQAEQTRTVRKALVHKAEQASEVQNILVSNVAKASANHTGYARGAGKVFSSPMPRGQSQQAADSDKAIACPRSSSSSRSSAQSPSRPSCRPPALLRSTGAQPDGRRGRCCPRLWVAVRVGAQQAAGAAPPASPTGGA